MKWRKRGRVYAPTGDLWWARSYAVLPTAQVIDHQAIRVYFAALDDDRYGRIGYVDLRADDPTRILRETAEPVLDIGPRGAFDDCGVNPSCVVGVGGRTHLYYIGWQRSERVPYLLFAGLAVADGDPGSFTKHSPVPVLDRTVNEPFSRSAPCVLPDGDTLRMWYWSCERWSEEEGWIHYNTVIRHAESADGIAWTGGGAPCIVPEGPADYAVGRPWVLRDGGTYKMWYSIRSRAAVSYRIGYAESSDGVAWTRKDHEAGIDPSASGWDSEMICYPCVVDAAGRRYMFYNGNRHGSTGFGCAVLES